MYRLPQAGNIANDKLVTHLKKQSFHQPPYTNGLFTHETIPISFTLVVDDFGVKYMNKHDTENLLNVLHEKYVFTDDWSCKLYIGISV